MATGTAKKKAPARAAKQPRKTKLGTPIECTYTRLEPIGKVKPNPANPNRHPEAQIALLAKVIAEHGWRHPIVVSKRSGMIVTGHGRLQAALLLNETDVPIDVQAFSSADQEHQHLIADNRLAELAEMDRSALADLLQALDTGANDMELTGYDTGALEELMNMYYVEPTEPPGVSSGGRGEFREVTFSLHTSQVEVVQAAVDKAKAAGNDASELNDNGNGNAIAAIAQQYLDHA